MVNEASELVIKNQTASKRRWTWRRRILVCLAVVLLVGLGPYVWSRFTAMGQRVRVVTMEIETATEKKDVLKVVCFNIAHGRGTAPSNWTEGGTEKRKRIDAIGDFLKTIEADIVVLNEVDFRSTWSGGQNQAQAIALRAGYPFVVEQRNLDFYFAYGCWQFGNAILSRYPVDRVAEISFPAAKDWEDWCVGCKRGVLGTLKIDGYGEVQIAGVHLEHRGEGYRVAGAVELVRVAKRSEAKMLIAAGDFNSTPSDFPTSNQSSDGRNAMEVLQECELFQWRPKDANADAQLTFSTMKPESVIDWILVSSPTGDLRNADCFKSYQVIPTQLSDHRAVVAEIFLTDSGEK